MSALEELIDPKIISIIHLLLKDKDELFHLQKISHKTGIPISTTFRIINKLVDLEFIDRLNVGNFKIYRIASNPKTIDLSRMLLRKTPSSRKSKNEVIGK
ncbi:MAG: helix-turn-helix domain-containing protein [Nanoarchaeota archaeon]|nr:helix-turn-helix domain-containing protein [Nanoarchaeota archaeon]